MADKNPNDAVSPNDVLLGRGGNTFRHVGNKKFRDEAMKHAPKYSQSTKLEKSQISRKLMLSVKEMNPPGRFLKKENHTWVEVDEYVAREKASQCLRDAVSSLQKVGGKVGVSPESTPKRQVANSKRKSRPKKESILKPHENSKSNQAKSSRRPLKGRTTLIDDLEEYSRDSKPMASKFHHVLHRGHRMHNHMYQSTDHAIPGSIDAYQEYQRSYHPMQPPFNSAGGGHDQQFSTQSTYNASFFPLGHAAAMPPRYPNAVSMVPMHQASSTMMHDNIQMTPIRPSEPVDNRKLRTDQFGNNQDFSSAVERQNVVEDSKKPKKKSLSSPDLFSFRNFFFPDTQQEDSPGNKSSPSDSPDQKRLKQKTSSSSDDLDITLFNSTSQSVDSIDSFSKPL